MKKQTKKEMKIKDLFTLSERTDNGAVVTTLENGNKYCFGYFSEEDKQEDIKNIVAKRERKVTASLTRRDLNENVFATKINDILSWWRDNLDKYEIISHAAKQLRRIESKRYELTMMRQRINNHEQVSEVVKYNGIRQEITDTITESLENLKHISARYEDMVKRVCKLSLPGYCVPLLYSYGKSYHTYPLMDVYNALPANWEEMAKHGIKSVNTDLLPHVKNQTEPTMVESEVVEPETVTEPTMVESEVVEPETVTEPTMVESEVVEPETITEPTMVEPEVVEPETVTEPTMVESVNLWLMSTAAAAVACLIVLICLSIKPRTTAIAAPTVATVESVVSTISEPTMVEPTMVEPETIDHINDVICTGSIDPYIEHVKEEITRNYRAVMKSQLQELAELASVDDSEVFVALETSETDPETPESVPAVETIEDTENTPESVEIMPTETDTETDTGTVSDNTEIDYNSSDFVELTVITTDANGDPVVNVYSVPLNE